MTRILTPGGRLPRLSESSQTSGVDTSKLAPETRRVWERLATDPALGGFVLIGGTALTMHIAHRISEDLDFIIHTVKLPRTALGTLIRQLEQEGFAVARNDDQAAYEEFLIDGLSLHDYQQDFLVNRVKVSFIAPSAEIAGMVAPSNRPIAHVASLDELFRTKALAAANRMASRDWIDLYVLITKYGFTLSDFQAAFQCEAIRDPAAKLSHAFQNLCRGIVSAADPGFETLMPDQPSLAEIAAFFSSIRDEYEAGEARKAFVNLPNP